MADKYCPEIGGPTVNEEGIECCEITPTNCIKTSESNSFLSIGIGKTLTYVINVIAMAIKKNKIEINKIKEKLDFKKYEVLVSQSGIAIPTAIIGINELAVTPIYNYIGIGEYALVLTGAFPLNKVYPYIGAFNKSLDQEVIMYRIDDDTISIKTFQAGVPSNTVLNETPLKIIIYNV